MRVKVQVFCYYPLFNGFVINADFRNLKASFTLRLSVKGWSGSSFVDAHRSTFFCRATIVASALTYLTEDRAQTTPCFL